MKVVILGLFVLVVAIKSNYTIPHYGVDSFDVEVKVEYETACSSKANFGVFLTVPRGSSILNVLERANVMFPTFNGFKLIYLANSSYHLIDLNGDSDTSSCGWIFTTNPQTVTIQSSDGENAVLSAALNDVFVSNIGMIITFKYTSSTGTWTNHMAELKGSEPHIFDSGEDLDVATAPSVSVEYDIQYTPAQSCVNPNAYKSSMPSTPMDITIPPGGSALNVMEAGANLDSSRHFVVSNTFGKFYFVESLNGASITQACKWCAYFTPSVQLQAAEYLLTADINNFIIPIEGGKLVLKYQSSCAASTTLDDDNDSRFEPYKLCCNIPIPPHYNPYMKRPKSLTNCEEGHGDKESCHVDDNKKARKHGW